MNEQYIEDSYPLSPVQQGMLFHSLYAPQSGIFIPQMIWTLHEDLNASAFKQAWDQVVKRHPILRTSFHWEGLEEPLQKVHQQVNLPLIQEDWRGLSAQEQESRLETYLHNDRRHDFEFAKAPLMRLALFQISETGYQFIWTYHHALLDGQSRLLIVKEIFAYYEAFCQGYDLRLKQPRHYRAHIEWLQQQNLSKAKAFWQQTLKGFSAPTSLIQDQVTDSILAREKVDMSEQDITLSKADTSTLKSLAQQHGLTLNTMLQGAWVLLLSRYSGSEDVVFGATRACRHSTVKEAKDIVGLFINVLPIRVQVSPEMLLIPWLKKIRAQWITMREYEQTSLLKIQEWSDIPPGTPLFESTHDFRYSSVESALREQGGNWKRREFRILHQSNVPLLFHGFGETELLLRIKYHRSRFDTNTIERMFGHYKTLLEGMVANPKRRLLDLPLLTETERYQLLMEWNDTQTTYPQDQYIHQLFETQADRTPDAIAVTFEDKQITYRELNSQSNQLAHYLRKHGVGSEQVVGICMERCLEMIIGLIAILKAGGAYVALEPDFPGARLSFMLEDTKPGLLLTQQRLLEKIPEYSGEIVCLDRDGKLFENERESNLKLIATPEDLAYVTYTSGTTGKPKGILTSHRNVVQHLHDFIHRYNLRATDIVLQIPSFSFDASVRDIFSPLMAGARIVIVRNDEARDPSALVAKIAEKHVTCILSITPSLLTQLVETGSHESFSFAALRHISAAGEPLPMALCKRVQDVFGCSVVNQYGPTECTIISSYHRVVDLDGNRNIALIGRPIANTQFYILNNHLNPVPVGVAGEAYIGGLGLSNGYLNLPDLTAEMFIPDPFSNDPGARLYKTGDMVCYLPDGAMEFLGRRDFQVKIRGVRIELGEIEATLCLHSSVSQAVVVAREDRPGDKRLVAYVVAAAAESVPSTGVLRAFLQERLPDYMIPSAFVSMKALPLIANRKVDRQALPEPDTVRPDIEASYAAPRSQTEKMLAGIWAEVLNVEQVGINDNFFDLGGHSLLIMRIHRQLKKIIGYEIPIITLFQYPTIGSLCRYLRREAIERTSFEQIYDRAERQVETIHQRDIAIIGMSGRFPKAKTLDQFWLNLREGRECISFLSEEDLHASGVNPALINNPDYVRASADLEDIELFDASFFGINPREAEILDPRQRLFLECAWEALENSGCDTEKYDGLIGVYTGLSGGSYLQSNLLPNQRLMETLGGNQVAMMNRMGHLSMRVSYKLNLHGPSVTIQTACSTSLVAVVFACQSLLSYQCDTAVAGGVSIKIPQKTGYLYREGGIVSPDGHCRAFDARAQGVLFGNGVGIVILKRLADALAEGDRIHAVIKGYAVNNDGALKVGYTAPAVDGQADVIAMAQAIARVKPETVSYIEAHGTGTPLGDPIELAALTKAFRAGTDRKGFCAIGSLKTNIGHLDAAAGVAGLIKTVLALENKLLPPSLHFEEPNPEIGFENSPFYVNTHLSEWTAGEGPRRAGVSSFGIGGTNAHVIVEEPPPQETSGPSRSRQLLLLSAKTDSALETATKNLGEHLKNKPDLNLADAAYTLQVGRREFSNRRVVVCQNVDDAIHALDTADPKSVFTALADMDDRPVVFMFSGQGSQYVNMGLELYRVEPAFRKQIDLCAEILKPQLGLDLRDVLYRDEKNIDEATGRLTETSMTQPALFTIEYALAKLLAGWGIHPRAMIGHSIGEYVAACMAGVFSLEDALELVAMRGRLIQELPGGAMLAVALSEKEIRGLIGSKLSLAAVNGASSCVISGTEENVAALQSELAAKNVHCRRLHTSHAFHSEMMEPILPQFTQFFAKIDLNPPEMRYISNVTGTWITVEEATDPTYWARHLRHTVRFADGIAELLKMPDAILLEIGPGRTLATLARQQVKKSSDRPVLSSLPHPKEQEPDLVFLLKTLGRLWLKGVKVEWTAFSGNERRKRISLPTYPFEHQRYWVDPIKPAADEASWPVSLGKNPNIADWFYVPSWNRTLPPELLKDGSLATQQVTWLVFADRCGLGDKMAKRMEQAGQDVIRVKPAERFERLSEGVFNVNPGLDGDYGALLLELKRLNKLPDRIVHLWGVTANEQQQEKSELAKRFQYSGFYSLLFLAQALGATNPADAVMIDVVTNNIHNVIGEEVLFPEKAMVLAPCKVIPQEFPNIKCRNIDITVPASGNKQEEILINQIMAELTIKPSGQCIAYRGGHRWLQTYEAVKADESPEETPRILRDGGIYLITGGLGGIGLVLSEYLARTVRAKLILTGRSAFPAKNEWNQWLETHHSNDSVSRKIRKVQALEDLGAEVVVCRADAANLKQMQQVINETYERFGNLHGVVHAAGILPGKRFHEIQNVDQDACRQQFQPKVNGLIVLEKVLQGRKCDFYLLTSSLASVLGGMGRVNYSAGNIFMDAFAQKYQQINAVPWISVNWDGWQFANKAGRRSGLGASIAELAMKPEEGKEVFRRILSMASMPQLVISTGKLQNRIEQWVALESSPDTEPSKKRELSPKHVRPEISAAYVAPRNENEQAVAEIWQELLGIQRVGIYDDYFELGGDSLLATQIIYRIREKFKVEISFDNFFEDASVSALSEIIGRVRWLKESQLKASTGMQQGYEEI